MWVLRMDNVTLLDEFHVNQDAYDLHKQKFK